MTPSSVLVVKPSSLGDIVHTLPAVHFLKATFPEAEFYWIANTEWLPLLEDNADLKDVIPFPEAAVSGHRPGSSNSSNGAGDYLTWNPTWSWIFKGCSGAPGFRAARGARRSSACRTPGKLPAIATINVAPVNADQHSVDRYLELAKLAGADISGPALFPLPRGRPISSLELPDRFVILHPFARGAKKSLTPDEIIQFTRSLAPHPVIIVGRSNERFSVDRNGISLVNRTDLSQLIWLLRRASFIVSVDSGPMHIGAAITAELLAIHTWSDPGLVGPYNPNAWIWKDQSIFQVRSIPSGVIQGAIRRTPRSRPDR